MGNKKINKSESILARRWRKFKSMKRAYYSLVLLIVLYVLSFFNPLLVSNRALVVKYDGKYHFPAFGKYYTTEYFGQKGYGEANYRKLEKELNSNGKGWVLLAPYEYSPVENILGELKTNPPTRPDSEHWLGTDKQGRDIFARLVYGFNISITFALIITVISYIIGIIIGGYLGFFGGLADLIGVRLIEIFSAIPFLYLIMIIKSILPLNLFFLAVLIIITGAWMGTTWFLRGEYLREKSKDYVAAAVSMGASSWRVMFKHILPNSLTPIITFAPFAVIAHIGSLVSLDFLGFGLEPPTPSWGELMNQGISDIDSWWLIGTPLSAMFVTLLIISFIGEGVREAFDPKTYSRLR